MKEMRDSYCITFIYAYNWLCWSD